MQELFASRKVRPLANHAWWELVRTEAYGNYLWIEPRRSRQDYETARSQLGPGATEQDMLIRAYEIWEGRKDESARQDWEAACQLVSDMYTAYPA